MLARLANDYSQKKEHTVSFPPLHVVVTLYGTFIPRNNDMEQ
jgi:hypothetical protein